MAKGYEVLRMLLPNGGWAIQGNDFDSIIYDNSVDAVTKEQFDAGLEQFDAWQIEQETIKTSEKAALLEKLNITEAEAKLLLS
jgi:hypothetical protein